MSGLLSSGNDYAMTQVSDCRRPSLSERLDAEIFAAEQRLQQLVEAKEALTANKDVMIALEKLDALGHLR